MILITDEGQKMIEHCALSNSPSYNANKALEECVEFQEVLLKLQTKHPGNPKRPKIEEAYKEFGDVIYRGLIALKNVFPDYSLDVLSKNVNDHIDKKLTNLGKYKAEGNYKGGL